MLSFSPLSQFLLTKQKMAQFNNEIEDALTQKDFDFEADDHKAEFDKFFISLITKLQNSRLDILAIAFTNKYMIRTDILSGRFVDYTIEVLQKCGMEKDILAMLQQSTTKDACVKGMIKIMLKLPHLLPKHPAKRTVPVQLLKGINH